MSPKFRLTSNSSHNSYYIKKPPRWGQEVEETLALFIFIN